MFVPFKNRWDHVYEQHFNKCDSHPSRLGRELSALVCCDLLTATSHAPIKYNKLGSYMHFLWSVQPIEFQNVVKPTINHKPSAAYHFYTFYQSGYKVPATINRMPKYYQLGLHWVHHTRITLANSGWNSHWQGYIGPRRQRNHRRTRTAAPHSVATGSSLVFHFFEGSTSCSLFRKTSQLIQLMVASKEGQYFAVIHPTLCERNMPGSGWRNSKSSVPYPQAEPDPHHHHDTIPPIMDPQVTSP